MKKITLKNCKFLICISFVCLFAAHACKKDRIITPLPQQVQLIKKEAILKWIEDNPAAKILTLDWKHAKQTIVNGNKIVRVPTLNIVNDLAASTLNNNLILGSDKSNGSKSNNPSSANKIKNPYFFNSHPPELFFVQRGVSDKIKGALLNFVPTDPKMDFGESGKWTGKLYSWNLSSDTLWVQDLKKSKLLDRYGLKYLSNNEASVLSKSTNRSKVGSVNNTVSCCFFEWLATKLGNLIGWLGDVLGLPTNNFISEFGGGLRIDWGSVWAPGTDPMSIEPLTDEGVTGSYLYGFGPSFDFENFPSGGPNAGGSAFLPYSLLYLIQNMPYLSDQDKNWFGQRTYITEKFAKYLQENGNINQNFELLMWAKVYIDNHPIYDIGMEGAMEKLFLIKNLGLSPEQDVLIHAYTDFSVTLAAYLKTNQLTQENIDFGKWAVEYLDGNRNLNTNNFFTEFFPTGPEIIADPDANNWTDPDNEVLTDLDQTVYQEYQDNQPWPTVKRDDIIPFEKFVPIRNKLDSYGNPIIGYGGRPITVNCLILAKEQLGKAGYTASGWLPGSQTFSIYKESTGVNLSRTKEAISYMIAALSQKIPVLIGVDNRPGTPSLSNLDNSTDHFVVVVGMGTDATGKYFQFVDNATKDRATGASWSNRLYYNTTTGKITGKTAIEGYRNLPNMRDYTITQVRKSIKK
ncbi:hypothetical protein [Pedobacter cryotolerans]|uniref:Peptidase C39-like domain-containing protein n=1 Tax=Pedobacter cryotolerans TaxID=2571270 RepID=A0A4U1C6E9_9SPHI|nr:hypothetical protein [Pedobacter cryotolerans]TKB99901.1 hypothetical protein FA045_10680 [Pedobacter cryotolerans]